MTCTRRWCWRRTIAVLRNGRVEQVATPAELIAESVDGVRGHVITARTRVAGGRMMIAVELSGVDHSRLWCAERGARWSWHPSRSASRIFSLKCSRKRSRRAGCRWIDGQDSGATEIAFEALRTGAIDVYPEYTGTGLLAILGEPPIGDAAAVYQRVSREFRDRFGVRWLAPLGFQNSYAIAVRRATADSLAPAHTK